VVTSEKIRDFWLHIRHHPCRAAHSPTPVSVCRFRFAPFDELVETD
jgi:hypothetical protein